MNGPLLVHRLSLKLNPAPPAAIQRSAISPDDRCTTRPWTGLVGPGGGSVLAAHLDHDHRDTLERILKDIDEQLVVDRRRMLRNAGFAPAGVMTRAGEIGRNSKRLAEIVAVFGRYGLAEPFRDRLPEGVRRHLGDPDGSVSARPARSACGSP